MTASALPGVLQTRFEQQRKRMLDVVHEQALKGLSRVQEAIRATDPQPVDIGIYKASWSADMDESGATVGSDAPHSSVIEHGARPFFPPLRPLREWAYRKFRVKARAQWRAVNKKRKTGRTAEEYRRAEANRIAYLVARAISRRGFPPRHVLKRATVLMRKDLSAALRNLRGRGFDRP
ncbi:MAG: hypothetical protein KAX80_13200 [Planctomycetes bacterium]|nr:hypothetical protein [Planctomycetota bacterium]